MTKKRVDEISSSFCGAKWTQSTIYLHSGNTHSCCLTPIHKVDLKEIEENPSALHHTKLKKTDRKLMKMGKKMSGCEYCWRAEESGSEELSERYLKTLDPEWGFPFLDEVKNLSAADEYNPKYLELSFDYKCNLRCMYCSPFLSTAWENEIKKYGPYPTSVSTGNLENIKKVMVVSNPSDNPFVKAFWKWWPSLKEDLLYLRLTGGEPLLDTDTWKILEDVTKEPLPNLSLCINSNLSVPDELITKLILALNGIKDKCRKTFVYTSCDSFGAQAEYIRYGLNFENFVRNIKRVIEETEDTVVSVTITFNLLSLGSLEEFLKLLTELKLKYQERILFSIPILNFPQFLNVDIAPFELRKNYAEKYLSFLDKMEGRLSLKEIVDLRQLCHRLSQEKVDVTIERTLDLQREDFFKFINEYDRRKGTNFLSVFPELKEFFELCLEISSRKS